jgi:AcrR family transcriptional regulator
VTVTPWGRADELRSRRLRPGPATSREEVEANQRERLFGAMVAAVAERGYAKTRVADLLTISGVSRSTFYRHFDSKQDCFLATIDAVVANGGERVVGSFLEHDGAWDERFEVAFETLVETIVESPAAAHLYYVDTYAAGREAIEKVEQMGDRVEQLAIQVIQQSPDHAGMPNDLVRAILRGFRRVIQTRLRTGRERELLGESRDLVRWAIGYRAPPERLGRPRKPPAGSFEPLPADPRDPLDRIPTAVIELMAEKGYNAMTINEIAQRASISLTTFYSRFEGKDDVVVAALRRNADRLLEATAPAYRAAPDWPHAVAAALHAFFAFLDVEQPFARFGGVDVHSGSRLVVEVRDQLLAASQAFIAEGYRQHPEANPIAGEAIGASIDALLFDQMLRRGPQHIYELAPTATYLALLPFVGADEACAIANASR